MFADLFQDLAIVQIPFRHQFRGIMVREIAIFRGSFGWSEFGSFLEYSDEESVPWLKAAWLAANKPWPRTFRDRVAINATLPVVASELVPEILARFPGCTTVKIKVDELESAARVIDKVLTINSDYRIRLDVNAGWDRSTAIDNLCEVHQRFGDVFDYVEQPCADLTDLAIVKKESPIRIAADESIRKNLTADFRELKNFADVAILKWQPLGGFDAAHSIAESIGLPVVISSALETGIGIAHGVALAASFENSDFACGLGTVALFESDICLPNSASHDGFLNVQRREPVDFERYLADDERARWWQERMVRIWSLIEANGGIDNENVNKIVKGEVR
jgi:O-succinylbenzoate synthase